MSKLTKEINKISLAVIGISGRLVFYALVLVLLVQRPAIWPVLVVLAVLWFALFGVFRYRVRSWVARWVCGGS